MTVLADGVDRIATVLEIVVEHLWGDTKAEQISHVDPYDREAETRFPNDVVAQIAWRTLVQRGMDATRAQRAMDAAYNYDVFGRMVDDIESAAP